VGGGGAAAAAAYPAQYDVSWASPSPQNSTSGWKGNYMVKNGSVYMDAMPLGNGDVVAMAWANASAGGIGCYVRKADAMSATSSLLTLALLQVALDPNPFAAGGYFNQTLHFATASVVVLAGGTSYADHKVRFEVLVDAKTNILLVSAAATDGAAYSLTATLTPPRAVAPQWPDGRAFDNHTDVLLDDAGVLRKTTLGKDALVLWHRNVDVDENGTLLVPWVNKSEPSLVPFIRDWWTNRTSGVAVDGLPDCHSAPCTAALRRAGPGALVSRRPESAFGVRVRVVSAQTDSALEWMDRAGQLAAGYGDASEVAARRAEHDAAWAAFWNRSHIEVTRSDADSLGWPAFNNSFSHIPGSAACPQAVVADCPDATYGCHGVATADVGAAISRMYAATRFVFAAQSRTRWPIKFNGMLYNANHVNHTTGSPDNRVWGQLNFWQNTRLPYWAMYAAGDFAELETLFEYYLNMLPYAAAPTAAGCGATQTPLSISCAGNRS
jgi:hypothetical protein